MRNSYCDNILKGLYSDFNKKGTKPYYEKLKMRFLNDADSPLVNQKDHIIGREIRISL
ncbi:hypothetical protein BH11BAC7_BH11BAC7_00390 [soil metagenome]